MSNIEGASPKFAKKVESEQISLEYSNNSINIDSTETEKARAQPEGSVVRDVSVGDCNLIKEIEECTSPMDRPSMRKVRARDSR